MYTNKFLESKLNFIIWMGSKEINEWQLLHTWFGLSNKGLIEIL